MLKSLALPALLALIAVGGAAPAAAQQAGTPEQFALEYMAATRASDWRRVADMMHPDALAEFKEMFGTIAAIDTTGEVLSNLFGVADSAAYAATSPDSIYVSFMKTMVNLSPELGEALSGSEAKPIGHVEEKETGLTHVLFRMRVQVQGVTISQVDVIPLKRHDGRWRAVLTGEMEGMAQALKQQLGRGM